MIADTFGTSLRPEKVVGGLVIALLALLLGYLLAGAPVMAGLVLFGILWLALLPYHSQLSVILAVATFGSAFILPFFPGRPFLWEFAALLGWSGLVIALWMRQQDPAMPEMIHRSRWLFVGLIAYCLVLVVTMLYRGVGFRVLGGATMGGRFYFQQLVCAIFPLMFAVRPMNEKLLTRLFVVQCALTTTYLLSDAAFSIAPQGLGFLLNFFELPTDAVSFEWHAARFGIRRYQSLSFAATGLIYLLLAKNNMKDFVGRRALFLIPALGVVLGAGVLSGHRYVLILPGFTVLFCAYAQRFFTLRHNLILVGVFTMAFTFLYSVADHLPLAAQRAASLFPGIRISDEARVDAQVTLEMRRQLFRIGLDMAPQYLWMGRGFALSAAGDYSWVWEPTGVTGHINSGRFYNGFVGLLVNTGVLGLASMLLFIGSGSALAWHTMRLLRTHGVDDDFSRVCSVVSGAFMASVVSFLFLHGDSEWALKSFALQAGLLIACHHHLRKRLAT